MAFERNDIVVKTKLADALGDELMGFEHNDIVTTDVMNAAIAGGGGGGDYKVANVTVTGDQYGSFSVVLYTNDMGIYPGFFALADGFNSSVLANTNETVNAKLFYDGDSVVLYPYNIVTDLSGDAVYDSQAGTITVTGDFSISGHADD